LIDIDQRLILTNVWKAILPLVPHPLNTIELFSPFYNTRKKQFTKTHSTLRNILGL